MVGKCFVVVGDSFVVVGDSLVVVGKYCFVAQVHKSFVAVGLS